MGLAASQARFLCLTARKADCEYKSTELAQQKLEITNQLSDISNEYSSAMNATKLMWSNDAIDGDYGLSYSLLMMPSAMNDYNPYMVTTPSGAIVLNSQYAKAAKAAGISKAGGGGTQESRDKFISALVGEGIVTSDTAKAITKYDYEIDEELSTDNKVVFKDNVQKNGGIEWNPAAGMGAEPKNKASVDAMTLADLCMSELIGQQTVDWAKIMVPDGQMTAKEVETEKKRLGDLVQNVSTGTFDQNVSNQLSRDLANYKNTNSGKIGQAGGPTQEQYDKECARLEKLIEYTNNIENVDNQGFLIDANDARIKDANGNDISKNGAMSLIQQQIKSDYDNFTATGSGVDFTNYFNVDSYDLDKAQNGNKTFTVVQNGVINHYKDEIANMTLGDILSGNIVIMSNNGGASNAETFSKQMLKMLDSLVAILGYSTTEDLTGKGLNVDEASAKALKFAYEMVKNTFLRPTDVSDTGSRYNDHSMTENSAYLNAENSNRIGSDGDKKYYGLSLSNMMSAFLTYYDNALNGADSQYVVGKTLDTSIYVTDNSGYYYIAQGDADAVTTAAGKSADFFDELYNNILEHGWREDAAIDDSEYLESAIKDGRYSMSSLNQDGYYYQTRYNETGYMVEVSDTDAIARAEAEFTSKKAELTYKEDSIDLQTKQLDAEISSISTEYDTVKGLISKSIEKTFAMFSS